MLSKYRFRLRQRPEEGEVKGATSSTRPRSSPRPHGLTMNDGGNKMTEITFVTNQERAEVEVEAVPVSDKQRLKVTYTSEGVRVGVQRSNGNGQPWEQLATFASEAEALASYPKAKWRETLLEREKALAIFRKWDQEQGAT
jgi:hypothetical protein